MLLGNILLALLLDISVIDTTILRLDEVTVYGTAQKRTNQFSETVTTLDRADLEQHFDGSLAATLELVAGVQSIAIGSGQSKPVIRGLGHQRLAVIHDGIRHEGQQWGDDHGLEIDQFAIDKVEIIKGPSALVYGSDAIGGVLLLRSNYRPQTRFGGNLRLFTRTNNQLYGLSAKAEGKKEYEKGTFFWSTILTYSDYADMRVPTDSIEYFSYRIPLYKQTLRNTAGREADGSLMLGWANYNWHTCIKIYENYAQSGFFANAHGLEVRLSDIDYDRNRRDIDLLILSS